MFRINPKPAIKEESNLDTNFNRNYLTLFIGIILISIGVSQCLSVEEFHSREKELLQRYKNNEPLTELEKLELCEWLSKNKSYEKEFEDICTTPKDTISKNNADYKLEFQEFLKKENIAIDSNISSEEFKVLFKSLSFLIKNRKAYEKDLVFKTSLNLWKQLKIQYPNGFICSTMSNQYKIKITRDAFLHIALKHQVFNNYLNYTKTKRITQFETEDQRFSLKDVLWSIETIFRSLTPQTLHRFTSIQSTNYQLIISYVNTVKEAEFYDLFFNMSSDTISVQTFYRNKEYNEKSLLDSGNIKEQLSKYQPNYFIYIKP